MQRPSDAQELYLAYAIAPTLTEGTQDPQM